MIILLEGKSKKTVSTGIFGSLLRGMVAVLFLVLGAFAITMAATAALILGGILMLSVSVWWLLAGKQRVRELMSRVRQTDFASEHDGGVATQARKGVVIEGELVREPTKSS